MPTPNVNYNTTVVGTDNHLPIYDYTDNWRTWSLAEIYQGESGLNKYVPKVNDFVVDTDTGVTYKVTSLSTALVPALSEINPLLNAFVVSQTDQVFGVQDSTYVAYLDKSVNPFVLTIDSNMHINGSIPEYGKIFFGVDTSITGEVISQIYNAGGAVIDNKVPLTNVALDSHTNYFVRSVNQCNTVKDLVDGEILTAVIYDATGAVVFKRQLRVEVTTYVRDMNAVQKTVSHIALESIFMSATDNTVVNIPINLITDAINFMGAVYYTDGSVERWAVDGTRFSLFGLSSFSSTIAGYKEPAVLTYNLQPNEASIQSTSASNNKITASYTLVAVNTNNSYSVKLSAFPVWDSVRSRYTLTWFLTTLDRTIWYNVTNFVQTNPATVFDGQLFGQIQLMDVSINLHNVSSTYRPFTHVQRVAVQLLGQPSPSSTDWKVKGNYTSTDPYFGQGVFATRVATGVLSLTSGQDNITSWLTAMYENAAPLIDIVLEATYPAPTHFKVRHSSGVATDFIAVSDWNKSIIMPADPVSLSSVTVEFVAINNARTNYLTTTSVQVK